MGPDHLLNVHKEVGVCGVTSLGLDQWDNVSARDVAKSCLTSRARPVIQSIVLNAVLR
jgi:hypothetical protein